LAEFDAARAGAGIAATVERLLGPRIAFALLVWLSTIAVVVDTIAEGFDLLIERPVETGFATVDVASIDALTLRAGTDTDLQWARERRLVFVDDAIAVVVDSVAFLDRCRVYGIVAVVAVHESSGRTIESHESAIAIGVGTLIFATLSFVKTAPYRLCSAAFATTLVEVRAEETVETVVVRFTPKSVVAGVRCLELTARECEQRDKGQSE
jgi:hypothetical protein